PNRSEHDPDVAMDAQGDFIVSYTRDFSATDKDIQAVRFTSSGARIGFVNDTHLDTGDFDDTRSSAAMAPTGRVDIAYEFGVHGDPGLLRLAVFDAKGVLQTDQQLFSQRGGLNPSVAMDNAGNAVVAYQTIHFGCTGNFHNQFDIEAQRFNSGG